MRLIDSEQEVVTSRVSCLADDQEIQFVHLCYLFSGFAIQLHKLWYRPKPDGNEDVLTYSSTRQSFSIVGITAKVVSVFLVYSGIHFRLSRGCATHVYYWYGRIRNELIKEMNGCSDVFCTQAITFAQLFSAYQTKLRFPSGVNRSMATYV